MRTIRLGLLESEVSQSPERWRQFKHSEKRMIVTVPGQLGKDVPVGTLRSILRSAGLDKEEPEESDR
jgi:hypothetical protein